MRFPCKANLMTNRGFIGYSSCVIMQFFVCSTSSVCRHFGLMGAVGNVPSYLCNFVPLYLCTFVPLYLCTFVPLYLLTFVVTICFPVYLFLIFVELYLLTFVCLYLCTYVPLSFVPVYLYTFVLFFFCPCQRNAQNKHKLEVVLCFHAIHCTEQNLPLSWQFQQIQQTQDCTKFRKASHPTSPYALELVPWVPCCFIPMKSTCRLLGTVF